MKIILTHQNADFDALASMLAAWKLHPDATPILPPRQQASVSQFLALYQNGLPFVGWDDFEPDAPITRIILTDTQTLLDAPYLQPQTPVTIYDHHQIERPFAAHETWAGAAIGAATTLLVEQLQTQRLPITSLEATLMALGIYADTGMMTYGGTTSRDIRAAAWLLEQGAVLDTVQRFLATPLNAKQQSLLETLLQQTQHRTIQGYDVSLCCAQIDTYLSGINSVTARLSDILDSDGLFVLVAMPKSTQLVCRSTEDAIHVGEIARAFGGGGHPRAAAATIYSKSATLASLSEALWGLLRQHIRPAVRVGDLMSYGAQTVPAEAPIHDLIQRIRRIGHEGYPVIEEGRIIGLLTLRDADRAMEHDLGHTTVRDVMQGGNITLQPDDSVAALEQTMVESGWGQIPIVDHSGQLIGIVTRTDLIKHWAQVHPSHAPKTPQIEPDSSRRILGTDSHSLIERIAKHAESLEVACYLVGGVVRDLLLQRPNFDIDFVIEGNAIHVAQALCDQYGGRIHSYEPFGTAKWHLDEAVAAAMQLDFAALPDHLDFATARSELYEHPTALPTVYNSGIKLDLRRRDFTINTLAVQLSPAKQRWHILDFYGGLPDLDEKIVRVLHSLSFVDDPTRILRAVRFSERLDFAIEARTQELIVAALPMLRRITGERLRNELTLLMKEADPERGLLKLEAMGALRAIHPDFSITPQIKPAFRRARQQLPAWVGDTTTLKWHLALAHLHPRAAAAVCKRLLFSQSDARALVKTAELTQSGAVLADAHAKPSAIAAYLSHASELSLAALWLIFEETLVRERIAQYRTVWQHIKPTVDGHRLKELGLKPGPAYRTILETLRDAWLDGDIQDEAAEARLLHHLIQESRS